MDREKGWTIVPSDTKASQFPTTGPPASKSGSPRMPSTSREPVHVHGPLPRAVPDGVDGLEGPAAQKDGTLPVAQCVVTLVTGLPTETFAEVVLASPLVPPVPG